MTPREFLDSLPSERDRIDWIEALAEEIRDTNLEQGLSDLVDRRANDKFTELIEKEDYISRNDHNEALAEESEASFECGYAAGYLEAEADLKDPDE
jgi:hypothetical protein